MATPIPAKAVLEFTPRPRTLPALEKAQRSVREVISDLQSSEAGITLVAADIKMFSNVGTITPGGKPDPDDWSKRRFAPRTLLTIVLA